MKRTSVESRFNATLKGLDALLATAPPSELGRPGTRTAEAVAVRRVLRRALASSEAIDPVRSDSSARMKDVQDFVRRHPELGPELVFGSGSSGRKRIDEAWAKIQQLKKGQRRRKK